MDAVVGDPLFDAPVVDPNAMETVPVPVFDAEGNPVPVPIDVDAEEDVISDQTLHHKVIATLRQCARDWSSSGLEERLSSYKVIKYILDTLYVTKVGLDKISILVPGAGLARLAYEISTMGFTVQGEPFKNQ